MASSVPVRGVPIQAAVEGDLDEAVARRLITAVGGLPGTVYGKAGKQALRSRVAGYNNAARRAPWFILVDLDSEADCALPLCTAWVQRPAPFLCFRVAVRQVEAWLLADRETLGPYLRVRVALIPTAPDSLPNPKVALVSVARSSRSRDLRKDMVPRPASGRPVGPAYTSRLIEYVERFWRPETAATRSESLARALRCLRRLVGGAG